MAAVVAALTLAGCGGQAPLATWPPLPAAPGLTGARWLQIADTLPPHVNPASANPCGRGTVACMAAIVGEMTRRLNALAATCSHDAPFAVTYLQVSSEVEQSVRLRRYQEPGYVAHLDAVFATLYFHASDAWRRGDLAQVPRVWQIAFAAAAQHRVSALGDMLLGMNAHISRDLPYAIAAVGLRHADGTDATADVIAVNNDIARAQDPMLRAIAERFDPTVNDVLAGQTWIRPDQTAKLIADWRLEAIQNARRLLAAKSHAALERVETTIDDNATIRSLVILQATSYPRSSDTIARDEYCEAQRAAHVG